MIRAICNDDQPTGDLAAAIVDVVCDRSPWRVRRWLQHHPELVAVLRHAATHNAPLAHSDLDDVPARRSVEYFRRQLIHAGLLPARHHHLALFDAWTRRLLSSIDDPTRRQQIATFATWHHRRRLATAIDNDTIRPDSTRGARGQINVTIRFLDWLDQRGRTIADCTQDDLDTWFTTGNTTRLNIITYITWARTQQLCHHDLRVPTYQPATPTGMPHHERVALVQQLLHDDTITTETRVAGLLVALYAQTVTHISHLPAHAVTITPQHTTIRLGNEHLDLPEPVARLIRQHLTNIGDNPWLFPGRTPGRPRSPHTLAERLNHHGVTRTARIGALHDLLQQIPSPVLADLLTYNPVVLANRATALAAPWEHYAAIRAHTPSE